MTSSDLTHLYFLLDRSGSMQSIKTDTEGGFAAFIEEQRKAPGECRVTLAQFDNDYEVVYADRAARRRTRRSTCSRAAAPRCSTRWAAPSPTPAPRLAALPEDRAARHGDRRDHDRRHGERQHEWTHPAIKALVTQQSGQWGWQFMYMGADQDADRGRRAARRRPRPLGDLRPRPRAPPRWPSASGKIAKLRAARISAPAAPMEAFTDAERASLAE